MSEAEAIRLTPQRKAILAVLSQSSKHPDASWIYQEVRKQIPHISLGTIYRNLNQLSEAGLITELDIGRASHWDGRTGDHYHVVCRRCERIIDLDSDVLACDVENEVAEATGFSIEAHHLWLEGICPSCQRAQSAPSDA